MPLFEYVCGKCGTEFEKIVPSWRSRVKCTECSSSRVEKKVSVFAVSGGREDAGFDAGCGTCGSDTPGVCGMN